MSSPRAAASGKQVRFPTTGTPKEAVLDELRSLRSEDVRWREGQVFGLVYNPGEEASALLKEAYTLFFSENALNPTAFPSLRRLETEVVRMAIDLFRGDEHAAGNMTSGGTESLLMAVKTARDWARAKKPEVQEPEMILPATAHPALVKAAHYFGLRTVHVPIGPDYRADVAATREALTSNTILLVGSAPSYPHGVMDPIEELAQLAQQNDLLFHVDACMGGFMLPFVRRLGYPVPEFDFSVPGVTSVSADLHKYGYAAKGASVILHREKRIRRHQLFVQTEWPGGIYASPTMTGSRPGGTIAAAWAMFKYLGLEGYAALAEPVMAATVELRRGIDELDGLYVLGDPVMSVLAVGSDRIDVFQVGDEMALRGWYLDRQQFPPSLHMTVNYGHVEMVERFLDDLAEAVRAARRPSLHRLVSSVLTGAAKLLPERVLGRLTGSLSGVISRQAPAPGRRSAALYGMMANLPNRDDIGELVLDLVEGFTEPQGWGAADALRRPPIGDMIGRPGFDQERGR